MKETIEIRAHTNAMPHNLNVLAISRNSKCVLFKLNDNFLPKWVASYFDRILCNQNLNYSRDLILVK